MTGPIWVTKAVVLAIHGEQLVEHGGSDGLRDEGVLDAALARPLNLHLHAAADISDLAACYGFGLCQNHPFVDGNKRTSFVVTELFLALNGWTLRMEDAQVVALWLRLASGRLAEGALAQALRAHLLPLEAQGL
ncbi:MAG: death-on-curing protein [Azorhizobium sp. 32-67-21]|nr:MAG: death-on-curing protein [Azorhizobium sp. 32-67-21]